MHSPLHRQQELVVRFGVSMISSSADPHECRSELEQLPGTNGLANLIAQYSAHSFQKSIL